MPLLKRSMADGLDLQPGRAESVPAVPRRLPPGCHLALVSEPRDFALLAGKWQKLETAAGAAIHVFQSFAWLNTWASTYGADLAVVTGYRGEDLVFAWPLMKSRLGPLTALRWMSEPHGQYGDVLLEAGQCPMSWLDAATDFLRQTRGIDIIRLRHVRQDSPALAFLDRHFRASNLAEAAPFLDLTAFSNEAAYEQRYSSCQRKRRKKIRKVLEEDLGPVAFEVLTGGPGLVSAMREAIAEKCRWIDERGRQNRILGCPNLPVFLEHLLNNGGAEPRLVVSRLTAGGRPVSWEIGLRRGKVHYCFITAHMNELTDYSPARLHMDLSQRQALKDGMAIFDLMVPNDAYKDSWCSGRVAAHDYHLPLTPLGRLYGVGYLEQLRPRLRHAYYNMSPEVLRLLKPIIGH